MSKQVILLGKGTLAVKVATWLMASPEHELACVVPVMPEPAWTGSLTAWATTNGVPVVDSGHYKDLPGVDSSEWSCELGISVFYDKIIRGWFIDKCERLVNIHNSPLPKYRGVSPINWALKNGENEHGVTIHEITEGIDDGPIVAQVKYSIYPEVEEVQDVYEKSLNYAWLLFQETMPLLDRIVATPQDHEAASYYSRGDDEKLMERRSFSREASSASGTPDS